MGPGEVGVRTLLRPWQYIYKEQLIFRKPLNNPQTEQPDTKNMKVSFGLVVGALAVSVAADYPSTSNICETSDASPYLHNVNEMIDNLNNAASGTVVCNTGTSGCGGTITGYSGSGGAAFMLCGDSFRVCDEIPV